MTLHDHFGGRLSELDERVVAAVPPGGNWRDLPSDFPSARVAQIRAGAAAGTGSRSTYYGRLHPDRPAYTISTYFNRPGNGCFIHPTFDRLITVREAARLQGFPDSFWFTGRGRSRFVQVGNAAPPLLAFQLAQVLTGATTVDLFCGAGGLALGFSWAGFQTLAVVDNDPSALETHEANAETCETSIKADLSVPGEVSTVAREVRRRAGADGVDVLLGGPPCQGFSTAGKWLAKDDRNDLVFSFVSAVEMLKPRQVVMENVAALLWRRGRPFLDTIQRKLNVDGYKTEVALLHAETFGVPQLRRRLILLASRRGEPQWPVPTRASRGPAYPAYQRSLDASLPEPVSVAESIGDLPLTTADDPETTLPYATTPRTPYQRWARGELTPEELLDDRLSCRLEDQMTLGLSA